MIVALLRNEEKYSYDAQAVSEGVHAPTADLFKQGVPLKGKCFIAPNYCVNKTIRDVSFLPW